MVDPSSFADKVSGPMYVYRFGHGDRQKMKDADFAFEVRMVKNRETGEVDNNLPDLDFGWKDRWAILWTGYPTPHTIAEIFAKIRGVRR